MARKKNFEKLTSAELWKLRKEIVLNSVYIYDYDNSFSFNPWDVGSFFDGYVGYLKELAEEDGFEGTDFYLFEKYDTEENLYSWFLCYDDLKKIRNNRYDNDNKHKESNQIH